MLRLEATNKQLERRLDEYGVAHAAEDETLKFHDMEALRKQAGVYAPLKVLPKVPVLATLQVRRQRAHRRAHGLLHRLLPRCRHTDGRTDCTPTVTLTVVTTRSH